MSSPCASSACAALKASRSSRTGGSICTSGAPNTARPRCCWATDARYWRLGRETYLKPPEMPARFNTSMAWGCPYDCGLCPEHMQHSCPHDPGGDGPLQSETARSAMPARGRSAKKTRDLATIEKMLDAIVANEIEPDVVQISGGEPTLHPDFFRILDAAQGETDPPLDAQHQRAADCAGARIRRTTGQLCAGFRGVPPVRLVRARRADGTAWART